MEKNETEMKLMCLDRKVAKCINHLAELPVKGYRLMWHNRDIPINVKRRTRRYLNKLNFNEKCMQAFKDLMIYGNVKIPLN